MSTQGKNTQGWDDMIFEDRNKAYGAYFIRKVYSKNVLMAGIFALFVIFFGLASPTIAAFFKGNDEAIKKPRLKTTVSLEQPPPINPDQPPPPSIPPPPVKTIIKFLPPKVTEKEVVEEEKMPTVEEIKHNETGSENVEGTGEVVFEEPVQEVVKDDGDANKIFNFVEQSAEFPGGTEALYKWMGRNIKYPPSARRMGTEGTATCKFVIEPDGSISNVELLRGFDGACDREAMRVIGIMPKWKPGKQGGRAVRQAYVLPVKFRLSE